MRMRRYGFTLVELLIVIVIIGILSAGMLLSMTSGEDNAQATAILSDLRIMKSGAYLFVTESMDFVPSLGVNYAQLLGQYMDHGRIINDPVRYAFYVDYVNNKWWVGVSLTGSGTGTGKLHNLIEKKALSGERMPLYGSDDISTPPADFSSAYTYKSSNKVVWTKAK